MAILDIVTGEGTPILRTPTQKVPKVTKDILKLLKNMEITLRDVEGAGLAAPQVDRSERLCVAMIDGKFWHLINPEITWRSEEQVTETEGCLSIPDKEVPVPRAQEIVVRYLNEKGEEQERKLRDWDARVVQHEVDHLDGKLIVDYLAQHR